MPTDLSSFIEVLNLEKVARLGADRMAVERGAGWIRGLKDEYPLVYQLISNFISSEPERVIDSLGMFCNDVRRFRDNENVLEYIRQLQQKLKPRRVRGL